MTATQAERNGMIKRIAAALGGLVLALIGLVALAPTASAHCPPLGSNVWDSASWGVAYAQHATLGCGSIPPPGGWHYGGAFYDSANDGHCVEIKRLTTSGNWTKSGIDFPNGSTNCTSNYHVYLIYPGTYTCGLRLYRTDGVYSTLPLHSSAWSTSCP